MKDKQLLTKSIILLYKESLIKSKGFDSTEKVCKVLDDVSSRQTPEIGLIQNSDREIVSNLSARLREMIDLGSDYEYTVDELLNDLELDCMDDKTVFKVLSESIKTKQTEEELKKSIINLRRSIDSHFREIEVEAILSKASFTFKHMRNNITNVSEFLNKVISDLDRVNNSATGTDPSITSEVDISASKDIEEVMDLAKAKNSDEGLIKTGWQALNTAIQGGFRRGEFWCISALASNWKTGFTMSIFKQIALYNKPFMLDPSKKPLLVRISTEDDIEANMQLLYQSLKYTETREPVNINELSSKEMSEYIKSKLMVNGYHAKFIKADPTDWSYSKLLNKLIEYEAEGYEIHCCMVDYLSMIPPTGCLQLAGTGSDLRDMYRRIRNFMTTRRILFITPHQLNSDANKLLRGATGQEDFTKAVAKRGYYDGCAKLIQELDGGLVIHSFDKGDDRYLSVTVEKHRAPTAIPESQKSFYIKYPPNQQPIPDDIDTKDSSFRVFKHVSDNKADDSLFTF